MVPPWGVVLAIFFGGVLVIPVTCVCVYVCGGGRGLKKKGHFESNPSLCITPHAQQHKPTSTNP